MWKIAWVTQHPLLHHWKNPILGFFGWDETQPNPKTWFCIHSLLIAHLDLQRSICFFFPHSIPTYLLLFHSSFPSLFPFIISSSFFGNSSFFLFWFSIFLCFFLLFSILCSFLWGLCDLFVFFSILKKSNCVFIWGFCGLFVLFLVFVFFFGVCGVAEEEDRRQKKKEEIDEEK